MAKVKGAKKDITSLSKQEVSQCDEFMEKISSDVTFRWGQGEEIETDMGVRGNLSYKIIAQSINIAHVKWHEKATKEAGTLKKTLSSANTHIPGLQQTEKAALKFTLSNLISELELVVSQL